MRIGAGKGSSLRCTAHNLRANAGFRAQGTEHRQIPWRAEMNSGGYSGFIDSYPETDPDELEAAILAVAYPEIAENYRKAVRDGALDEWVETDTAYYKFSPSLCDCLMRYVEDNRDII